MTGPYRSSPPVMRPVEAVDRPWWAGRLWRRLRHRRCLHGLHHPELTFPAASAPFRRVHLTCGRCLATRVLVNHGLGWRATGEWLPGGPV